MNNYEEDNILYDFNDDIILSMEDEFFENNTESYFEESYINKNENDNEYSSSEFIFEAPFSTTYSDYEIDDITTDTKSSSMESINDNNETWNEPINYESLDVEKEFGPFSELEQSIYFFDFRLVFRIHIFFATDQYQNRRIKTKRK